MPIRVPPQPSNAVKNSQSTQSRTSSDSRTDDSGSGAESRARKKFQKSISEGNVAARRLEPSIISTKGIAEPRSSFTSRRRQSIRDQKAPLGPRPPDFQASKRNTSGRLPDSFTEPSVAPEPNDAPTSRLRGPSIPDSSRFNFGTHVSSLNDESDNGTGSFDFLPSISFDDFHASITSQEPSLNEFPAPGRGGGILAPNAVIRSQEIPKDTNDKGRLNASGAAASNSRIGRSGSLLQRHNSAARHIGQASSTGEMMGPPTATVGMRNRRQSEFPALSTHSVVSRPPRKSIGPGVIGADFADRVAQRRRPSLAPHNSTNTHATIESNGISLVRLNTDEPGDMSIDRPNLLAPTRHLKTKSLQPPPTQTPSYLSTPSETSDHNGSSSLTATRSPGRSLERRTNTPSSSAKRLSVMPAHATGLGARTISPTDARRLKRLSIMQNAPPMPQTPPTPQPDSSSGVASATQSPSYLTRKSVTPSSSRTTPEHNRKSYSSGLSVSSNTSYNSLRTSSGLMQSRHGQNLSTSRLPTPKPRIDSRAAADDEEVPPVPAIPKAYESPKTEVDQPFFSGRRPSLPLDASNAFSSSATIPVPTPAATTEGRGADQDLRGRRGTTIGLGRDLGTNPSAAVAVNKKRLQPLRLPPLNLLPLSTPTAAKIAAFQEPPPETEGGNITPPPKRTNAKTPSTPMTASKASFFSKSQHDEELPVAPPTRSNSSHFALRSEASSFAATSDSSSSEATATNSHVGRQAISPFVSSSLPKVGGEFSFMRSKVSGEYSASNAKSEMRATRLTGPRAQTVSKARDEKSSRSSSTTDGDMQSLGTSIRRKLSLNRKKGTSRPSIVSTATEDHWEQPPLAPKHDIMPPPRLPASATWSSGLNISPSPTTKPGQLQSKMRVASNGQVDGHGRTRSDTWDVQRISQKETAPIPNVPDLSIQASTPASSALAPMHRIMSSKTPLNTVKAKGYDTRLDKDDLSAEEEMRKLASKRKDFETAAREVDELRRRATPKEKVSPAQAIRIVDLNIFERGEIVDFKEIYFCGTLLAKKHVGDLNAESANFGYDDDRGDYKIIEGDHIAYRYEIVDVLGKGSFGQVARCVDHKTGGLVAIKIIRNKKRFHQQALVEVNILQKLREWDPHNKHSMVSFTQSFYFRGHLCISTELLGMNLYEFIKSNDFRGFSLKLIRRFTKQLLNSLLLLKAHRVIHCDLKPENVLLAHPIHSEIKVIDFGSSCFENEKVYTYIQSRFYRSPEVILGMAYGLPIDMWSLGCILAELFTGYPIFPGENEQEQLACIMEVFGPPEKHLIEKSTRKKLFFDSLGKPRTTISSKGRRRRPSSKSLQQALKCDDDSFLDFLTRCLRWDPDKRLQPDDAIQHEFITGIKPYTRSRTLGSTANSSPIKRFSSVHTPAGTRPLPEPPATSFKNGAAVRSRDLPSSSPVKAALPPKRHSTVHGLQSNGGVRRVSNGAALGTSSLPRVAARTASGKPDLAAAAAAASLRAR